MEQDNHTDVRINNKVTIYGNVTIIGSISVAGVGFLFLAIWMFTHWKDAIVLSAVLVYGLVGLFGLTVLALVTALWIKIVYLPLAQVKDRRNDPIRHSQDNCIITIDPVTGRLQITPLIPERVVDADGEEEDVPVSVKAILDLRNEGLSYEKIADLVHDNYSHVREVCKTAGDRYDKRREKCQE